MDLLKMLDEFIGQILIDSFLSEKQQEEKIIQVFDLCHFISYYERSLAIVDCCHHKISIVEDGGVKIGIYFCDLIYNARYFFDESLYNPFILDAFRSRFNVKELWFVIVEERFKADNITDSACFIKSNNVDSLYDKIFHFNFPLSIIKILK